MTTGQKIGIGVLILIALLFTFGLFAGPKTNSSSSTTPNWMTRMQGLLPSPKPVSAGDISGPCIHGTTIQLRMNAPCTLRIAARSSAVRSLAFALPEKPSPFAGENVDADVTPNSTDSPAIHLELSGAGNKQPRAEARIMKEGASVVITCKSGVSGACSVLIQ